MVIETSCTLVMNLFPLPGYSQYLALSWVEIHLPDGKFVEVVLKCITVSI